MHLKTRYLVNANIQELRMIIPPLKKHYFNVVETLDLKRPWLRASRISSKSLLSGSSGRLINVVECASTVSFTGRSLCNNTMQSTYAYDRVGRLQDLDDRDKTFQTLQTQPYD